MSIPPPQRDFAPNLQAAHRAAGAAATKKALNGPRVVDWDTVIERFKKDMAVRYEEEQ